MRRNTRSNKRRPLKASNAPQTRGSDPFIFVIRRHKISKHAKDLLDDLKRMYSPCAALKLKARQSNNMKDFVAASGTVGATHMCVLSSSGKGTTFRAIKFPNGPTATFMVESYSTSKTIREAQIAKGIDPVTDIWVNKSKPLVVTSDIPTERYSEKPEVDQSGLDVAMGLLKGMHPSIDTAEVLKNPSSKIRRVVMLGKEGLKTGGVLHMRTYAVVKRKGGKKKGSTGLQLIGPNLTLRPLRVESGVGTGTVLWPPGAKPNVERPGLMRRREHEVIQRMKKREQEAAEARALEGKIPDDEELARYDSDQEESGMN